jgi:DNA-directed RNA polymerase I, II, and III subunit RPABC2
MDDDYGDEDSNPDDEVDILDEEEAEDEVDELVTASRGNKRVPDNERITSKFMTKYERARILGTRAL